MGQRRLAAKKRVVWAMLSVVLAAGCAGEGPEASLTTTTIGGASGALADIQRDIFNPSCATLGCHDALSQSGGLVLSDVTTSFAELVGISSQCGTRVLVVAGQPQNSYLLDKLGAGSSVPCGSPMPLGRPALGGTEIQLISDWISGGAPAAVFTAGTSTTATVSSTSSSSSTSTTILNSALQSRK